jgi:hypothetical protein
MKVFRSARFLLLAFLLCLVPASSFAGVFISIGIAPPVMPVYEQPLCPEAGLMWTPGYWAYGDGGYYWVPGAWVPAPTPGFLWTPPYWGWEGGNYIFHDGYWGLHVGYYGGVNYGFGYMGVGFAGGEWRGGVFNYNTAVMRVNTTVIHNTYVNETIVHNTTIVNNNHTAYSGGPGGIKHEPTPEEKQYSAEKHTPPTAVQTKHIESAAKDPQQRFSNNHGKPATVAAAKPMAAPAHTAPANKSEIVKPQPKAAPEKSMASKPATQPKPMNEPKPAPKPATQSRPQTAPHANTAPKPESRPAPKAESRPAPRPESHPAPKAESHPAPKPKGKGR